MRSLYLVPDLRSGTTSPPAGGAPRPTRAAGLAEPVVRAFGPIRVHVYARSPEVEAFGFLVAPQRERHLRAVGPTRSPAARRDLLRRHRHRALAWAAAQGLVPTSDRSPGGSGPAVTHDAYEICLLVRDERR